MLIILLRLSNPPSIALKTALRSKGQKFTIGGFSSAEKTVAIDSWRQILSIMKYRVNLWLLSENREIWQGNTKKERLTFFTEIVYI
jgi:hypothetical protein